MRASFATLFAVAGAAAAADSTWKLMSTSTGCKFGRCFTSYVVSGEEFTADGVTFPAFAARCKTMSSCTNAVEGSVIDSIAADGVLTITQTVVDNGVKKSAKAVLDWDESSEVYLEATAKAQ
ncbi:hypothetical protein F5B22DRAFT_641820 [Xylaria bambusicola]|uniref:uncharacterized protein n=1 Tax=Xylaria bambusicola TaxID=326684 RepID=UPI002007FA19|nr:uncharacterized protein F5B22DRAFT_641820 [Xylaria bambusicola]KAI0526680.1 hypothetical protein F5B22DRAFT_641820 [Xylaria bambusicola]